MELTEEEEAEVEMDCTGLAPAVSVVVRLTAGPAIFLDSADRS